MSVGPVKETLQARITPVQVDPLCDTETQNHVILLPLTEQQLVILQDIIPLRGGEQKMKKMIFPHLSFYVILKK